MSKHKIICGKSEIELKRFKDNTFDSCVTDPPYGLEFMGKDWDKFEAGENIAGGTVSTGEGSYWKKRPNIPAFYQLNNLDLHAFQQFTYQWATELYRVMKPGAHILVFGGTRTYHRMACAIEDAGFEVRDMIEWFYGSGFPKSLDISKSLDKMVGEEPIKKEFKRLMPDMRGDNYAQGKRAYCGDTVPTYYTDPATEEAIQWNGWGTGLKPAHEPILLARKTISERNIASNVLKLRTGGLNIGECRISHLNKEDYLESTNKNRHADFNSNNGVRVPTKGIYHGDFREPVNYNGGQGRFPANLILECCCEEGELIEGEIGEVKVSEARRVQGDWLEKTGFGDTTKRTTFTDKSAIHTNSNCVCRMLDEQSGKLQSAKGKYVRKHGNIQFLGMMGDARVDTPNEICDCGGASRFFYQAKASQAERWFYCTICKQAYPMKERDKHIHDAPEETKYKYLEFHPTQKPLQLIQYLARLITPPNGTMLDPFLGSGTGLIASEREGFNATGIDSNREYCLISYQRLKNRNEQTTLTGEQSKIERIGF